MKKEKTKNTHFTKEEKETSQIAEKLALEIVKKKKSENAFVLALVGDLGAGKTAFTKGFAKSLGIKKVTSPTFVIFKPYSISKKIKNFKTLYHVDCYRIKEIKELEVIRFYEILNNPENIVIIEWADRIKKIIPKNAKWITISHGKLETERKLAFK
ncbi:MAG: tRNA (adenosine(37)-N6)-threonylcarbamoyltransferase complex ATPase subunit type 1 TsaE [Candidatus Harrisonbacteria bacterium CG10_big_fil_rev_8_21_14_0_10_40_38]|uniref:tRNA threonylcarbamoyladenosine biosynthesis protein TsaE n=1 Tax=Candidatus Harrisonbacteria bacterium CG10_big_fil_rev_8_21_14_0_10_40_38 TaxID=1974583 RepID=A0A2H0UR91_9BACT|nr:MAG: tRNA (adenosine(37)-N6)-threonylcarbamoyltransferase complex ATPase subunit type 1 TsaE [Candidatus Harrisonbacteria bacterium CG10_big_fil_rev_8_21_14_0_10_40_38]